MYFPLLKPWIVFHVFTFSHSHPFSPSDHSCQYVFQVESHPLEVSLCRAGAVIPLPSKWGLRRWEEEEEKVCGIPVPVGWECEQCREDIPAPYVVLPFPEGRGLWGNPHSLSTGSPVPEFSFPPHISLSSSLPKESDAWRGGSAEQRFVLVWDRVRPSAEGDFVKISKINQMFSIQG